MDPQIFNRLKLADVCSHGLSRESFAHFFGLKPALIVVDSTGAIITSFPADCNGWIITAIMKMGYKVNASMQAA